MKIVLGFELTDEQFEELVEYANLEELKNGVDGDYSKYPENYIHINIYNLGGYLDKELTVKVFSFLNRKLGISKQEFIYNSARWMERCIKGLPPEYFLDNIEKYDFGTETMYTINGYEIDKKDNIIIFNYTKNNDDPNEPILGYFCTEDLDYLISGTQNAIISDLITTIKETIENYKDAETHDNLSLNQKKDGLNHTVKIISSVIEPLNNSPIKDKALNLLQTIQTKINSISSDGRPRQLEELIKRIDNANVGYIMQDEKTGKIFYPIIADMFIFELRTIAYIKEPIIEALWSRYYEILNSEKSKEIFSRLDETDKRAVMYLIEYKTTGKQRHYLASLFSKELKIEYTHIKKLIEHLFYTVPKNAKLPNRPINTPLKPFIKPLTYSFKIVS